MLHKYANIWDGTIREIKAASHRIEIVLGTRPIAQAPYRAGHKAKKIEDQEVQKMLNAGVFESTQLESSPVLRVPKLDGYLRFRVDYWRLNAVAVKDTYPLPCMDEFLYLVEDKKVFSALGAISGYWQMPIPSRIVIR